MINVFDMCDDLVQKIQAFDTFQGEAIIPDGMKVNAVRDYHYVDGKRVPDGELSVVVYPLSRVKDKAERGATKLLNVSICIVIKAKTKPTDRDRNDAILNYGVALDTWLEGQSICGAKNILHEDELFFWFPDELHKNNHFSSAIIVEYQHVERRGGNQ